MALNKMAETVVPVHGPAAVLGLRDAIRQQQPRVAGFQFVFRRMKLVIFDDSQGDVRVSLADQLHVLVRDLLALVGEAAKSESGPATKNIIKLSSYRNRDQARKVQEAITYKKAVGAEGATPNDDAAPKRETSSNADGWESL